MGLQESASQTKSARAEKSLTPKAIALAPALRLSAKQVKRPIQATIVSVSRKLRIVRPAHAKKNAVLTGFASPTKKATSFVQKTAEPIAARNKANAATPPTTLVSLTGPTNTANRSLVFALV